MTKETYVDNPGGGDCAFYAFGIGLIQIIKNEKPGRTTFNRWVSLDPSMKEHYESLCAYDYEKPHKHLKLLNELQMSLRRIAYDTLIENLQHVAHWYELGQEVTDPELITSVMASSIYNQFAELYYDFDETKVAASFNHFKHSKPINDEISRLREDVQIANSKGTGQNSDELEKQLIVQRFLYLYAQTNSPIVSALGRIKEKNLYWGTLADINELASVFKVNLHTHVNTQPIHEFRDLGDRPSITLQNLGNVHWKTGVKLPAKTKESIPVDLPMTSEEELNIPLVAITAPKKPVQPPGLEDIQRCVHRAVLGYLQHSNTLRFSFFYRHGEAGRVRANKLLDDINGIKTTRDAWIGVINVLYENDGNTNPHSLKTMLLRELLKQFNEDRPLTELSKAFDLQLGILDGLFKTSHHSTPH